MSDLVSGVLTRISEIEESLRARAVDPFAGLPDDELHQHCWHPAYEYRTTEGQRKAWDDVDTPPEGDGWELNITSRDSDAFARFDYHEERYWRRLRPEGSRVWEPPAEVTDGLRLCRAHRQIVDMYGRTKRLLAEANERVLQHVMDGTVATRQEHRDFESLHVEEAVLQEVIEALARRGVQCGPAGDVVTRERGVVEEDRNGE